MARESLQRRFRQGYISAEARQGCGNPEFLEMGDMEKETPPDPFHSFRDQDAGQTCAIIGFVGQGGFEAGNGTAETEDAHSFAVGIVGEHTGTLAVGDGERFVVTGRIPDLVFRRQGPFGETTLGHRDRATGFLATGRGRDGCRSDGDALHESARDGRHVGVRTRPRHSLVRGVIGRHRRREGDRLADGEIDSGQVQRDRSDSDRGGSRSGCRCRRRRRRRFGGVRFFTGPCQQQQGCHQEPGNVTHNQERMNIACGLTKNKALTA